MIPVPNLKTLQAPYLGMLYAFGKDSLVAELAPLRSGPPLACQRWPRPSGEDGVKAPGPRGEWECDSHNVLLGSAVDLLSPPSASYNPYLKPCKLSY